jgi:hypothetical protein
MKRLQLVFVAALAGTILADAGCSKKKSEEAPLPPPTVTTINTAQPPPKPQPSPSTTGATSTSTMPAPAAADTNQATGDDQTPAQLDAQVKQLENDYHNTADFQKRVTIIYDLSSNESSNTVDAIGRLFLGETDQELKIELVNSLTDIDGQNDKKLAILSSAMRADQPKEVRLEAIDGMGDVEDKRGIQILQGFLNDSDEEVRDAVKDAIEQLQNVVPQPQSLGQ